MFALRWRQAGAALALLGLATSACRHLPAPGERTVPPISFKVFPYLLPSGLRVVLQEDHSAPLVAVVTVVGVGTADDPAGKEGLAHLVEHLTFEARPNGSTRRWDQLEDL